MKTRRQWSRIYSGKKENATSALTTCTKCGAKTCRARRGTRGTVDT